MKWLALFLGVIMVTSVRAASVDVLVVTQVSVVRERLVEGVVEAASVTTASAETTGRVAEVLVDVGDVVSAGATVLRLVSVDQQAGLDQARAQVAEAQASYSAARQQFDRVDPLYAKRLLSKSAYDDAQSALRAAQARLKSAEASLKKAQQRVSYTTVKAAYGGVVSARHVEVGEAVQPGTPMLSGFDPKRLRVIADIPQSLVEHRAYQPDVQIELSDKSRVSPTSVTSFPMADPGSGTRRIRLDLPSDVKTLYPGQLVKVAVQLGERQTIRIPLSSLLRHSEVSAVYVWSDERVALRQVRVGRQYGNEIEVLAGLRAGESILRFVDQGASYVLSSAEEGR